jgi:hypothetical protein
MKKARLITAALVSALVLTVCRGSPVYVDDGGNSGGGGSGTRDSRLVNAANEAWVWCEYYNNTQYCEGTVFQSNGTLFFIEKEGNGSWERYGSCTWSTTNNSSLTAYCDDNHDGGDGPIIVSYRISGNTLTIGSEVTYTKTSGLKF